MAPLLETSLGPGDSVGAPGALSSEPFAKALPPVSLSGDAGFRGLPWLNW